MLTVSIHWKTSYYLY